MPLQATSGAASYDAFGGGVPVVPAYIEEVFSTYLYTGTGAAQTITNGIDLSTKGGLVWIKRRDSATNHQLADTVRGATKYIYSNLTDPEDTVSTRITSFNSDGFSLGSNVFVNNNTFPFVSWTFRKQPKFFDVVTYTGTGVARTVSHNLGSVPGCIIVKRTDEAASWQVYHRGINGGTNPEYYSAFLNLTDAASLAPGNWNNTAPTSTEFTVGTNGGVNASGNTYVAYLFAHDAGGFGLTGTDNVISCGSFTGGTGGVTVTLGYEPQWVMVKNTDASGLPWLIWDNMRGFPVGTGGKTLQPDASDAEATTSWISPTATGFVLNPAQLSAIPMIYIAIRRGPMKVPTSGTSVFGLSARTGTGANATVTGGAGVSDAVIVKNRGSAIPSLFAARLTNTNYLVTSTTAAQVAAGTTILQANPWDVMDGVKVGTTSTITNASANTFINYLFDRAPSFMDVVCWAGDDAAPRNITHNLTVVPEMMIVKNRTTADTSWVVYHKNLTSALYLLQLETTAAQQTGSNAWRSTAPTASVFTVGNDSWVNQSGSNYVNYLFATCAGVSKVGEFSHLNGTATDVDCGFTSGARFILFKRYDDVGSWYVYDSARGIVSGNDPYLLLNSTAAEVTNTDFIDPLSSGFQVSSSFGTVGDRGFYIFLAIA